MRKRCDASYKLMFSLPETVRDLVMGFIPDDWLRGLDYGTLEKVPCSYVSDDLRQRADDVVWRIRVDGEWVYLYLLMEFQSTVDPYMAVRIKTYVGLLYQDLIRAGNVLPARMLPPVLPIVLYNGEAAWTAATDVADMVPAMPGLLAHYQPAQAYLLIDEGRYSDEQLTAKENLVACMIRFQRAPSIEVLCEVVNWLDEWLPDSAELRRAFALWLGAVVSRRSDYTLALPEIEDLKELNMTLAQRFDEWKQQFRMEGLQEGRQEGEALLLQRILTRRFGPLPPEVASKIASSPAEQIDVWADRLLSAATLDEVFRP
jgi:predicted transposase YdaD